MQSEIAMVNCGRYRSELRCETSAGDLTWMCNRRGLVYLLSVYIWEIVFYNLPEYQAVLVFDQFPRGLLWLSLSNGKHLRMLYSVDFVLF